MNIKYLIYRRKYQKNIEELNSVSSVGQLADYNQTTKNPIVNIKEYYFFNGGCFWIAVDIDNSNKVVGMVGVKILDKNVAKVKALRVRPDYRHHHIAKQLMEILEKYCRKHEFSELVLGVGDDPDSLPAIKLYESLGFIKQNREEKKPGIWALNYYKDIS